MLMRLWKIKLFVMKPYYPCFFVCYTSQCSSSRSRKKAAHLIDYKELSNVKIPKQKHHLVNSETNTHTDTTLFDVNILESDEENDSVKINCIGCSDEYNEWRPSNYIVDLISSADNGDLWINRQVTLTMTSRT